MGEITCLGRRWTAVQNLTPLALSSPEKSVTVQMYNQHKQTVTDISTPCLSACVDNKQTDIQTRWSQYFAPLSSVFAVLHRSMLFSWSPVSRRWSTRMLIFASSPPLMKSTYKSAYFPFYEQILYVNDDGVRRLREDGENLQPAHRQCYRWRQTTDADRRQRTK